MLFPFSPGVATFVRDSCTPVRAEEGLTGSLTPDSHDDEVGRYGNQSYFSDEEQQELDREGRAVLTQHRAMYVWGDVCMIFVL